PGRVSHSEEPVMRLASCVILFLVAACPLRAERPPQDKKEATDVVVGVIQKMTLNQKTFAGDGVLTTYVAEVKVDKVERGEGAKAGDTVKVTWFRVTKFPTRPIAGAAGHRYGVREDDMVRAYLVRGKGDLFDVIYNDQGMEKLKK